MRIFSRAEWDAAPPRSRHRIDLPTDEHWLHHSAGASLTGDLPEWFASIRSIQDFHMRPVSQGGRGWSDIAYSFLIGGGQVFEGRGVGIAGGHTAGRNRISHAVCVLGNYEFMHPRPDDLRAIADLARHGQNQGWWDDLLTGGHRDAPGASTACPGRHLHAAIPEIRRLAAATPAPPADPEEPTMVIQHPGGDWHMVVTPLGVFAGTAKSFRPSRVDVVATADGWKAMVDRFDAAKQLTRIG